jgi:LysM domain
VISASYKRDRLGALGSQVSTQGANSQTSTYSYTWFDGAVKTNANVVGTGQQAAGTTTYSNDAFGQLISTSTTGANTGGANYRYDAAGQGIATTDTVGGTWSDVWHRMGGVNMWHHSNRFVLEAGDADTGQSQYRVRPGDSLQSIAQLIWGDSSLWYKLAEANGLSAQSSLTEGQTLTIPPGVFRTHQNASTFIPYDAGKFVGDTDPSVLYPTAVKPHGAKCGAFGIILMIAIAVAVTIATHGATAKLFADLGLASAVGTGGTAIAGTATVVGGTAVVGTGIGVASAAGIAGGVASAALGSIASQSFGLASGIQQKFSFKQVALAGLSAGVGAGLGGAISSGSIAGSKFLTDVVRGALGSAVTQGVATATGLQKSFDWTGVAAAGIGAGIAGAIAPEGARFGRQALASGADAIAQAATRSLVNGTDFGDNILASLPSVIGNLAGRLLYMGGKAIAEGGTQGKATGETKVATKGGEVADAIVVTATNNGGRAVVNGQFQYSAADIERIAALNPLSVSLGGMAGAGDVVVTGSLRLAQSRAEMAEQLYLTGLKQNRELALQQWHQANEDARNNGEIVVVGDMKSMRALQDRDSAQSAKPIHVQAFGAAPGGLATGTASDHLLSHIEQGVPPRDTARQLNSYYKASGKVFGQNLIGSAHSLFQLRTMLDNTINPNAVGDINPAFWTEAQQEVSGHLAGIDSQVDARLWQDAKDLGLIYGGTALALASVSAPWIAAGYFGEGTGLFYGTTMAIGSTSGIGLTEVSYQLDRDPNKIRRPGDYVAAGAFGALAGSSLMPFKSVAPNLLGRFDKYAASALNGGLFAGLSDIAGQFININAGFYSEFNWTDFGRHTAIGFGAGLILPRYSGLNAGSHSWEANFNRQFARFSNGNVSTISPWVTIRGAVGNQATPVSQSAAATGAEIVYRRGTGQ